MRLPALVVRTAAILLAALGLVPVANLITAGAALPWWPGIVSWWLLAGTITLLVAWLASRIAGQRVDLVRDRFARVLLAPSSVSYALLLAAVVFALSAAASIYCFNRQPQSIDEFAQLWQARILLAGHLRIPAAPHPEFFSAMNVVDIGGWWYSQFPIGGPLAIAPLLALGAAWLAGPLWTALALLATYRFVRLAFGDRTARVTSALLAVTPFFIFMGATTQNHVPALALAMLALAECAAWHLASSRRARLAHASIIGLSVGAMATIRPLDALAVALAIGALQLVELARDRDRWPDLAAQCAAGLIPVTLLLWSNAALTGHALEFGYTALWGPNHGLGFHASPFGEPHTPTRALVLASLYLMKLDVFLFEWPIPALLPIVAALLLLRRPSSWDALLAALVLALLGGYALYWHNGHFLGPRFLFTAIPAFVIIAVRAPAIVRERLGDTAGRAALVALPLCIVVSLALPHAESSISRRAEEYRGAQWPLKFDIAAQARDAGLRNALVFVHEGWGARQIARMWALGVSRPNAELLRQHADACRLELALEREERSPSGDANGITRRLVEASATAPVRPRPDITPDETLRFEDDAPLAPACRRELDADSAGVSLFPPFLALERVRADGGLGGDVVYARDLGARNEALRARFGDRVWYRYRPRRAPGDTSPAFERY